MLHSLILLQCQRCQCCKHIFDILKAKTASLGDTNFEKRMFVKENDHQDNGEGTGGQAIITGLVMPIE